MADNYHVGTHQKAIHDSQPRGAIWGRTGAAAVQNPPLRNILFASPQQHYQGWGVIIHQVPPSQAAASPATNTAEYKVGTHQRAMYDAQPRGRIWGMPPPGPIAVDPGVWVGSAYKADQQSTEQPFARFFRVASIPSVVPSAPPNKPHLFAGPQQTNLDPFAKLFRVATIPNAAVPPFIRVQGAPQQSDFNPFARLFKVTRIPNADVPLISPFFVVPQLPEYRAPQLYHHQPTNAEISPVEASVRCRAYRIGWFNERIYRAGDIITITNPLQYSPYWMAIVDALPAGWSSALEVFVLEIDIKRLRWLEQTEVAALLRDPNGPYRRRH